MELRYCEKCGDLIKLSASAEKDPSAVHFVCDRCTGGRGAAAAPAPAAQAATPNRDSDATFERLLDEQGMNFFSPQTILVKQREAAERESQVERSRLSIANDEGTADPSATPMGNADGSALPARTARKLQFHCLHCRAVLVVRPVQKLSRMVCPRCRASLFITSDGIVSKQLPNAPRPASSKVSGVYDASPTTPAPKAPEHQSTKPTGGSAAASRKPKETPAIDPNALIPVPRRDGEHSAIPLPAPGQSARAQTTSRVPASGSARTASLSKTHEMGMPEPRAPLEPSRPWRGTFRVSSSRDPKATTGERDPSSAPSPARSAPTALLDPLETSATIPEARSSGDPEIFTESIPVPRAPAPSRARALYPSQSVASDPMTGAGGLDPLRLAPSPGTNASGFFQDELLVPEEFSLSSASQERLEERLKGQTWRDLEWTGAVEVLLRGALIMVLVSAPLLIAALLLSPPGGEPSPLTVGVLEQAEGLGKTVQHGLLEILDLSRKSAASP